MVSRTTAEEGGQDLCVSCGLCCDGTVHDYANIESPADVADASRFAKFEIINDGRAFRLPCTAHDCGKCQVYEFRPKVCRDFQCITLKALLRGDVTFPEARKIVEDAKERRANILNGAKSLGLPIDSNAITLNQITDLISRVRTGDGPHKARMAALALEVTELMFFVIRHFSPRSRVAQNEVRPAKA